MDASAQRGASSNTGLLSAPTTRVSSEDCAGSGDAASQIPLKGKEEVSTSFYLVLGQC